MISSCRPRKETKPNTRCSTVAARLGPSGTPATRGLSGAVLSGAVLSGAVLSDTVFSDTGAEAPVSVGSLASLGAKGEDTRQSYGPAPTVGGSAPIDTATNRRVAASKSHEKTRLRRRLRRRDRPALGRGLRRDQGGRS